MLKKIQWDDFQQKILGLPQTASPMEVSDIILGWLKENSIILDTEPFLSYNIKNFLLLQQKEYPIIYSPVKGTEFENYKRIFMNYSFKEQEHIARNLSNILEKLFFYELDKQCPICEHWGLFVWSSKQNNLFFECPQCTSIFAIDGQLIDASSIELKPANMADLKKGGLIQ